MTEGGDRDVRKRTLLNQRGCRAHPARTASDIVFVPIAEVCEESLARQNYRIKVAVLKYGKLHRPLELTTSEVYSYKKRYDLWGFQLLGRHNELFSAPLQFIFTRLLSAIENKHWYDYTGWAPNSNAFVLGNLYITPTAVQQVQHLDMNKVSYLPELPIAQAVALVTEHLLKTLKRSVYAQIFLAFTALSLLFSKIKANCGSCVNFALYVHALYSSGKTATITAMTNPWGAETLSFEDTEASLTQSLKECRDLPMLVDDMSKYTRPGMIAKAERLARLAGDPGTAAKKMRGPERYKEGVNCLTILSGEKAPPLQQSSYVRMLILNFQPDYVNWQELTKLQHEKPTLTTFWVRFLQYIMEQQDLFAQLDNAFLRHRESVLEPFRKNAMSNRYAEMYAWLMSAWELLTQFCASHGSQLPDLNIKAELQQMMIAQNLRYGIKPPTEMFLLALSDLLERNQLTQISYDDAKEGKPFDIIRYSAEWWLKSKTVYQKVQSYYEEQDADFNYSEAQIRKDLAEKGLLKIPNNAKGTLTTEFKTRANRSIACLVLNLNICKKFINERIGLYDENEIES